VVVEREGDVAGDFFVVLRGGGRGFGFSFDGFNGTVAGIYAIDGKTPFDGPSKVPGAFFKTGEARTVTFSVRKNSFTVLAEGKEFYAWTEGWTRLSVHPAFQGDTGKLGLGTLNAVYRIKRLTLVTLSAK